MQVNPQQDDPQFQSPNQPDSEQQGQFSMQSQPDAPRQPDASASRQPTIPTSGQTVNATNLIPGIDVYGSDGKKVGTVKEVYQDSFLVHKGVFFVHDYYIPYTFVAQATDDRVDLSVSSDQAKNQSWHQRPQAGSGAPAGPQAQTQARPTDYGPYGPSGSGDTIQAATERGVEGDQGQGTQAQTTEYGTYGPRGSGDTIQGATEHGVEGDQGG
jgi:hypothetical protein